MTAGVTLRVLAWFAYQPALFFGDSFRYLGNVGTYDPAGLAPIGYELFVLTPALEVDGLELVTALQHLAGVGSAIALYALALRLGANRWLAALAAAPLLLDGYQIQIEQLIMSDIWQQVLLVALLWVLLGTGAPSPRRAALAGLLLGVAVMLRLVAISLVVARDVLPDHRRRGVAVVAKLAGLADDRGAHTRVRRGVRRDHRRVRLVLPRANRRMGIDPHDRQCALRPHRRRRGL